MKYLALYLVFVTASLAETPDEWFNAFYAHTERSTRKVVEYVEMKRPGDTTYRRLTEQSLIGQMPLLRYLLKYYLAKDPSKLTWEDDLGPFLQVLPCNCGKERSIDTDEFRTLFPAYSKASSAWEEIDWELRDSYSKLRGAIPREEKERRADEAESTDLKARFLRLKEANQPPATVFTKQG